MPFLLTSVTPTLSVHLSAIDFQSPPVCTDRSGEVVSESQLAIALKCTDRAVKIIAYITFIPDIVVALVYDHKISEDRIRSDD